VGDMIAAFQFPQVSGTYGTGPAIFEETVRLDVDGSYPQMMASGTRSGNISKFGDAHWVAYPLKSTGDGTWEGPIHKVWGNQPAVPHQRVRIQVAHSHMFVSNPSPMTITFTGGAADRTQNLSFQSPYFRTLELEIDRVVGSDLTVGLYPLTPFNPCLLDDRPAGLPCGRMTIEDVYRKAGIEVTRSRGDNVLSGLETGIDKEWSDRELNDAMRVQWSRRSSQALWAIWLLVATKHIENPETHSHPFGTMFDDSDQFHRQGLAIFTDTVEESFPDNSVLSNVQAHRKCFFAALHEMGHCFNLFHPWQKWGGSVWDYDMIKLEDLEKYPTIMNYPENFGDDFYKIFHYRFADSELKFIRHAPESFVQMGASKFGSDHAYEPKPSRTRLLDSSRWALSATLQRPAGVLEFLEPAVLTLEVTNAGRHAQILDAAALESEEVAVTIASAAGQVHRLRPFVRHCYYPQPRVLEPGGSLSTSMYVSAGVEGWYISEPGAYTLYTELETPQISAAATPLKIRVAHPRTWDEELIARDYFSTDVARALVFGGTHSMSNAITALTETLERAPKSAAARHAAVALAQPFMRASKAVRIREREGKDELCLEEVAANPEKARKLLEQALLEEPEAAEATFGKLRYRRLREEYTRWLEESGERGHRRGVGATVR